MVKRLIIFMLVLTLCISTCACGETEEAENDPKETASEKNDPSTDPSDPDDPTNPGSSETPTGFQVPEEAARSFLTAWHRNDAETLMKQTPTFENDAILRHLKIDVPAGTDKEALLLNAWKSVVLGQYAPDRQIDVTTTVCAEGDTEEAVAKAKNQFLAEGFATEEDLAEIEEIVLVACAGASAGKVMLSAKVFCMKIDGHWYTSYVGTSIWTGADTPPSVG